MSDRTFHGMFLVLLVLAVGFSIWWNVTYRCVASHHEWRTDCTVHRDSEGRRTGETCRQRRVDVCDEWVER